MKSRAAPHNIEKLLTNVFLFDFCFPHPCCACVSLNCCCFPFTIIRNHCVCALPTIMLFADRITSRLQPRIQRNVELYLDWSNSNYGAHHAGSLLLNTPPPKPYLHTPLLNNILLLTPSINL